jgi:hypothetical protein
MATKKATGITVTIPSINLKKMVVKIQGMTPLIVHEFSEKSRKKMLETMTGEPPKAKEPRNPVMEFIDATYWISGKPTEGTEEMILLIPKKNNEKENSLLIFLFLFSSSSFLFL